MVAPGKAEGIPDRKETVPPEMEFLRRWRVLAEPGEEPRKDDFAGLKKEEVEQALKTWRFLQDLVLADKDRIQDGQRSPDPNLR